MIINLVLGVVLINLIGSLIEHRKELKETDRLKRMIQIYDKSDKVIKDCVVYGKLPLTIKGSNITVIDCRIENLGKTWNDPALLKLLGN